jgi:peroxiredoxin
VLVGDPGPARGARLPRLRRRIAPAGAIGLVVVAFTGPVAIAEDPAETLRLTRPAKLEPAALFSVPTPDGSVVALADLRGKVVLLNFWATWCEPCLEEMPAMERLARTYRERGLVVLALSVDREGASVVGPFLKRHALTFPVGLDLQQTVARLYRVWALPSTFVLDRTGARLFLAQGARDWDGPVAHAFFDALLKRGS